MLINLWVDILYFGHTLISWKWGKQHTVAHSSTETTYKALTDETFEVIWLQYLLLDLHITPPFVPMIWCDNLSATYLFMKPIFHAHTKHFEVDYHFVHDRVAMKAIQIHFISSKDQLVDVLTKPLSTASFIDLRCRVWARDVGVKDLPPSFIAQDKDSFVWINLVFQIYYGLMCPNEFLWEGSR